MEIAKNKSVSQKSIIFINYYIAFKICSVDTSLIGIEIEPNIKIMFALIVHSTNNAVGKIAQKPV